MKVRSNIEKAFDERKIRPHKIFFYKSTDSTNERARKYPAERTYDLEMNGTGFPSELFIADEQTVGRGRVGRKFVSNSGAGLYMSVRFDFPLDMCESVGITPLAAVAVCRALKKLCGADASIKWVNDIYMNGKKLAGILTESTLDENGKRKYICGIGINLLPSEMPKELADLVTNLAELGYTPDRFELAAAITEELLGNLQNPFSPDVASEYKSHSFLIGKSVSVIDGECTSRANVIDISDRYELTVRFDNGAVKSLSTGEVSIKL